MAENKKSFVAYCDWKSIFDMLSDEEAGLLVKHLFSYVNDEDPVLEDRVLKMAFESIKLQLKRDLKKYEGEIEKKSLNGRIGNLKRWYPDIHNEFLLNKITLEEAEKIAEDRKASHSDNFIAPIADTDNVTVTDNVTDTDNNSKSHCDAFASPANLSTTANSNTLKNSNKKEKKVAPKKEKETKHFKALVEVWFKFYKSKFIIDPTFNAVQGKLLKSIIEQFEKLTEAMDKAESTEFNWSEDRAIRIFLKFLENAWQDKWLQEHFLLKNLLSNFDAIINKKVTDNGNQQQSSGSKKQFRFSTAQAIKTITSKD